MKSYNVEIFDRIDCSKDRYKVEARSKAEAAYKFCVYILENTDMTFDDFEIIKIEERRNRR